MRKYIHKSEIIIIFVEKITKIDIFKGNGYKNL